jgi:hypothetical protein
MAFETGFSERWIHGISFFISKNMPWHIYRPEKLVSKVMKTFIDFKKIVPDPCPSLFFYWKLLYFNNANIKRNQVM